MLLFQYGSNMRLERLDSNVRKYARHAPTGTPLDIKFVGRSRLAGWSFALDLFSSRTNSLVANILKDEASDGVWGALYELDGELVIRSDGGMSVLDVIEGHGTVRDPENYEPIIVSVEVANETRLAFTYVGLDDARERCAREHGEALPSLEYVRHVLDGARSIGVPTAYLVHLESLCSAGA